MDINLGLAWESRLFAPDTLKSYGLESAALRRASLPAIDRERLHQVDAFQVWYEEPLTAEWMMAIRLALVEGRVVPSELRVLPAASVERRPRKGAWIGEVLGADAPVPRGGLRVRTVRHQITFGGLHRRIRAMLRAGHWRWPLPAPTVTPGGGTRGRKPNLKRLARVAVEYEKAYVADRNPTQAVRKVLRFATAAAARGAVWRARQAGMLETTDRGVGSGRATAAARRLCPTALPRIATDSRTRGVKGPQLQIESGKNARKSAKRTIRA